MYFSPSEHGEFNIHPSTVEKCFDKKTGEECNIACEDIETKRYSQTTVKSFELSCVLMFNFVAACSIFTPQSKVFLHLYDVCIVQVMPLILI